MKFPTCKILFASLCISKAVAHEEMEWIELTAKLPTGLSDMTATYMPGFPTDGSESNAIVLAGGCSDPNGNEYSDTPFEGYFCNTVTNRAFVFFPSTQRIIELPVMPEARYRHSAALVDNKLYIIGGRAVDDSLITTIIYYDPQKNDWFTLMDLADFDAKYQMSDQGSLGRGNRIFIFGGWSADYSTTFKRAFSIDIESKEIVDLNDMIDPRGDISVVYYNSGGVEAAYTMGGFHGNSCGPRAEAEMYNFDTNIWTAIDPLGHARGDKAVVVFNDKIHAIGGETKHESACEENNGIDISSYSLAVDTVESYDPREDKPEWEVESDMTAVRFRAAAAADEALNVAYIFGGQLLFDPTCNCYATSENIFAYREVRHSGASVEKAASYFVVTVVTMLMLFV